MRLAAQKCISNCGRCPRPDPDTEVAQSSVYHLSEGRACFSVAVKADGCSCHPHVPGAHVKQCHAGLCTGSASSLTGQRQTQTCLMNSLRPPRHRSLLPTPCSFRHPSTPPISHTRLPTGAPQQLVSNTLRTIPSLAVANIMRHPHDLIPPALTQLLYLGREGGVSMGRLEFRADDNTKQQVQPAVNSTSPKLLQQH